MDIKNFFGENGWVENGVLHVLIPTEHGLIPLAGKWVPGPEEYQFFPPGQAGPENHIYEEKEEGILLTFVYVDGQEEERKWEELALPGKKKLNLKALAQAEHHMMLDMGNDPCI